MDIQCFYSNCEAGDSMVISLARMNYFAFESPPFKFTLWQLFDPNHLVNSKFKYTLSCTVTY